MTPTAEMRVARLLSARLCHELIGPATAVENGVELIGDDDPDFAAEAVALVAESARRTTTRLQFYRFAYGYAGEERAAGPAPGELAARYFATEKVACDYRENARALSLAWQQLACNLLLVGTAALPRGGRLALDAVERKLFVVVAGEVAALADEDAAAMALATPPDRLTPRTVQAYFTGLLAKELGARLVPFSDGGELRIETETAATQSRIA
jgi:histidine phosphotransferase ChpT